MERFFKELKPFEKNMVYAKQSRFVRNIYPKQRKRLIEIYNAVTGKNKKYVSPCLECMVEVMAGLHDLYMAHKNKPVEAEPDQTPVAPEEPKPRRRRKPKAKQHEPAQE